MDIKSPFPMTKSTFKDISWFPNSRFFKLVESFTKLSYDHLLTRLTSFKTLRSSSWVPKRRIYYKPN